VRRRRQRIVPIRKGRFIMDGWQSVVLGVVEGLTEYLPVSSTGHLLLAERAMGIPKSDALDAYAVCIQAGAILAVLGLYAGRVRQMALGLAGRDPKGLRLLVNLVAGVAPAVVLGVLLEKKIKALLFGLWPVTAAWCVGGVVILLIARWMRKARPDAAAGTGLDDLAWRSALLVGLIQCVAMWPGTSRSLVTILGGVLMGLSLPSAVEFSFLLGVVTLTGAAGKDAVEHGSKIVAEIGWGNALLGIAVATVSAAAAVKWMVSYLRTHSLAVFGWYRIALAVVVAGLLLAGVIQA
jgi:undecaprenyl-diphosphatase